MGESAMARIWKGIRPHFWRDLLFWSVGFFLVAAVVLLFPVPEVGLEAAVQVASQKLVSIDPAFRPADHVARVYRECGRAPLTIDYSRHDAGLVAARVRVNSWGLVRESTFIPPELHVES